jgi:hypothetical protein
LRREITGGYGAGMSNVYSSGFEPDPLDPIDVLAFVLCPIGVFAPSGDEAEVQAVAELIGPAKAEAVKRWHEAFMRQKRS